MQVLLIVFGSQCRNRFRQNRKSAPHTSKTPVFRKAPKLDRTVMGARDLVNGVGDRGIGDVSFIGGIVENDCPIPESVVNPRLELLPSCHRTGWIIWKAEIDEIDALLWNLWHKAVCLRTRKINESSVVAELIRWSGVTGHYIGVDVNGVDRIDHCDSILIAENIQNVTAIAFGAVRDKDLIVGNIHAFFAVIVFRNRASEKFVTLLGAVAAERFPMCELIDRSMDCLDCRDGKRLGDVPDAAPDQSFSQLRMFVAKRAYSAGDLRKKVSAFEFEIVIVKVRHRRNERQRTSALEDAANGFPRNGPASALRCRSQSFGDVRSSQAAVSKCLLTASQFMTFQTAFR